MRFCPKCETRLILSVEKGKPFLICERCGYHETAVGEERLERRKGENVIVIEKEKDVTAMSEVTALCPKCGSRKAFWWTVQTRGADEGPTQFFRCKKCRYTWRII